MNDLEIYEVAKQRQADIIAASRAATRMRGHAPARRSPVTMWMQRRLRRWRRRPLVAPTRRPARDEQGRKACSPAL
jgi:hypothetical protein